MALVVRCMDSNTSNVNLNQFTEDIQEIARARFKYI